MPFVGLRRSAGAACSPARAPASNTGLHAVAETGAPARLRPHGRDLCEMAPAIPRGDAEATRAGGACGRRVERDYPAVPDSFPAFFAQR